MCLGLLTLVVSSACIWPTVSAPSDLSAAVTQTWEALSRFSRQTTEESPVAIESTQGQEQQAPTATSTPGPPMMSVSVDTNCRSGPGMDYEFLGALMTYEQAEVLAQGSEPGFWVIENPDNPGTECWVGEQYASIQGDTSHLPVRTPPPTATPEEPAPSLGSVAGFLYHDGNHNGQYGDPQDSPLPNLGVHLLLGHCSAMNAVFAYTTTNSAGGYSFSDVPAGPYCLVADGIGWLPSHYDIDMDGQHLVGLNFRTVM
jgi:hypothetical protein